MIRINLLPYRDSRKKDNVKKSLLGFIIILAIFGAALFFVHKWLTDNVNTLNSKILYTRTEIDKYNKINTEIKELRAKLELLNTKLGVIASLQSNRFTSVTLMDNLTQTLVKDDMWLTQMTTSGNDAANLTGLATDNKVVADFMLNLETIPRYTQVSLKSVRQTAINSRPLKEFTLNFSLTVAPPETTASIGGQ